MPVAVEQRYVVKIVFRGLCIVRRNREANRLDFFLPDASMVPQRTAKEAEGNVANQILRLNRPYQEHHAVLEFPQADWDNRSTATPRLLQVTKPTKEPVALYLLRKESLEFAGLHPGEHAAPALPPDLADDERYLQLNNNLVVLERDDTFGFNQMPTNGAGVLENEALRDAASAARAALSVGEARTERRSRRGLDELAWRERRALDTGRAFITEQSGGELPPARALNLDVVVRFTLPIWNPLRITCTPFSGATVGSERTFLLRPSDPARGITVWVKNRELTATLLESDLDPEPFPVGCPEHNEGVDRDHALLALLAQQPDQLNILHRALGDASDCASGCGCTDGRP